MTRASLPMYWRAENADLWRAFWAVVQDFAAREGCPLPDLTAPEDLPTDWHAHWRAPDLALSMTCGLPFRTALKDKVQYIGTFGFQLNCPDGHYFSRVITRDHLQGPKAVRDLDSMRLAYNAADSQSGWAVSQRSSPFLRRPRFCEMIETGSHAASLKAVAEGRADIAYIDAVTWRILKRFDPNAARVHVLDHTAATPGLPLIAARGTDPAPLRTALLSATAAFAPKDPYPMGGPISFFVLDESLYHAQPIPIPPPA